jgi:hypothetical protein
MRISTAVWTLSALLLGPCAGARSEEICKSLADKLATLDLAKGAEVQNSRVGKPYRDLYGECDRVDSFNGQALPLLGGRRLKCSTDPNHVAFIRKFPDGTIVFRSKMGVDADGSPASRSPFASPADQPQTSLRFETGTRDSVNAEDVSFVVIPQTKDQFRASFKTDTGAGLGDLVAVFKGDRCSFGIVADEGPAYRIGEASMRAHEDLGNAQCRTPGQHPCLKLKAGGNGVGIGAGVTYVLFPRTRPRPLESSTIAAVAREKAAAMAGIFFEKFQ